MNPDVTLRRVLYELKIWADAHGMIEDFMGYGQFLQVASEDERNYMAMVVNVTSAPSETWYINYNLEVMVLEYVNDEQDNRKRAMSDTREVINDLEETIKYSNRWQAFSRIDGTISCTPAVEIGADKAFGWIASFELKVKKRHGICKIQALMPEYDFETGNIVGPTCDPVTLVGNTTTMATPASGSTYTFAIKDTNGLTVGTWNALTLTWEVPPAGGDSVTSSYNGTSLVDTPAGENKAIVGRNSDLTPVGSITTNDANNLVVDVDDVTIDNSDVSYTVDVPAEGNFVLPDITITDSDGSPVVWPAVKNFTCTPAPAAAINTANPYKTGQTTSVITGDDGDTKRGRGTNFLTLDFTNPFGNTNRLTDDLGGQTYASNVVINWATYNQVAGTVLGFFKTAEAAIRLDTLLAGQPYTRNSLSGWYVPNFNELNSICDYEVTGNMVNYAPFNFDVNVDRLWTCTVSGLNRYFVLSQGAWTGDFFSTTNQAILVRQYTLAELGL